MRLLFIVSEPGTPTIELIFEGGLSLTVVRSQGYACTWAIWRLNGRRLLVDLAADA